MGQSGRRIEFDAKSAADQIRVEFEELLAEQDLERPLGAAAVSEQDRAGAAKQMALSDSEKEQIDFSETNIFEAHRAKGTVAEEGGDVRAHGGVA